MKYKLITGLMVTLFLVNILSMVGSVSATVPGDINNDGTVNMVDVVKWALAFGSEPGDPNWDAAADINGNGIVNIFDGVVIGSHFGEVDP